MGLDSVELIVAFEDAFGLAIPDEDAAGLITPRHVIDYLHSRVPNGTAGVCLSQRAFYRLRAALTSLHGVSGRQLRPSTQLGELLTPDETQAWGRLQIELAAEEWPRYRGARFAGHSRSRVVATAGELADFLAERSPSTLVGLDEGWTRSQVAEVVHRLIRDELGIENYSEDSRFVEDMGVD